MIGINKYKTLCEGNFLKETCHKNIYFTSKSAFQIYTFIGTYSISNTSIQNS